MNNFKYLAVATTLVAVALTGTAGADQAKAPAPGAPAKPAPAPPPTPIPPAMTMPTPSAELAAFMKPLEGSWKCESTVPAGAMGNAEELHLKSTVKFKKEAGGFFWRGQWAVAKQKNNPVAMSGEFFLSYDAAGKQIISNGISSMGEPSWVSGAIDGTSVTMTGQAYMMGNKVKVRESMGSKDKGGFHTMEVDLGKGFTSMGGEVCKR